MSPLKSMHVPSHYTTRRYSGTLQSPNYPITHHSQTFSIYSNYRIIGKHPCSFQLVSLTQEFDKILLKNLLIYSMRYQNRHITLSLHTITMNCAGLYFTRQDILEQISTLLQYFNNQVHSTLTHPLRTMNEEDANIFFKGALQIYVEFWNSRKPLVEYIPYVPKP